MGMGFIARSAKIEIADAFWGKHAKGIISLGGEIYASILRCSGDKEDRLFADHLDMLVIQCIEKFGHPRLVPKRRLLVQLY